MQIGCKRFGCQKAVEVCYWTCKYRRNCKDWAGSLEGQPGLIAITERLETAAQKSGRIFDSATLSKPARIKGAAKIRTENAKPESVKIAPVEKPTEKKKLPLLRPMTASASLKTVTAAKLETNGITRLSRQEKRIKSVKKVRPFEERTSMAKPQPEAEKISFETNSEPAATKSTERKSAVKPLRPKLPASGTIYLLLSKNGKYKELREADLNKEAANIFKDSSLRLVKGQFLVPQITFKPVDE